MASEISNQKQQFLYEHRIRSTFVLAIVHYRRGKGKKGGRKGERGRKGEGKRKGVGVVNLSTLKTIPALKLL